MYLKIENPGVCPLEGWFILGLSTARGNQSSIGQFGTGNKHAVCVLLRHNVEFYIYRGTEKLTFFTVPKRMGDTNYQLVCYRSGNSPKVHQTSMCLEHGALDWTTIDMALRELVSNAVDASDSPEDVLIERVDSTRAKANTTRVYIRALPEVIKFYNELYDRFLVFDERRTKNILTKSNECTARIYRKGVLICTIGDKASVFDYNCGDDLKIDETRNLSEYAVRTHCAEMVAQDSTALATLFVKLQTSDNFWESTFNAYDLISYRTEVKKLWQSTWTKCFGDNTYLSSNQYSLVEELIRDRISGMRFIRIHSQSWYEAMSRMDIPTITKLFNELDKDGLQQITTTQNTKDTFNKVWGWLTELGLTENKSRPNYGTFHQPVGGEKIQMGKYDKSTQTVYLNEGYDDDVSVALEELLHHISGCQDLSRAFQDAAIESWAKTLRFIFE